MIIDFDSKNKGGGGKEPVVEALNVTANGTYNATSGVDGFNPVEVNVPQKTFNKASLTKEYTANGQYSIATPDGYDGISDVSVNVNVASSGGTGFDFNQLYYVRFKTKGTTLDLTGLDTSTFTSMDSMFYDCANLTSLDLSHFDTIKVTNMSYMFKNCGNLTSLDLSHFDTSKVTDMISMFSDCSKLTSLDLSHFNTSNVSNMYEMFNSCSKLTSLDLSSWDTSNVTNMGSMFLYCGNLTSLDLSHFNTSNVTQIWQMFYSCKNLTSLDLSGWNTSNVTYMAYMFGNCTSLETINCNGMRLPDIDLSNIKLDSATKLTVDSIVGLLNALPQTTNNYSFQIGSTNLNKLSEEQKNIAINKGWTLV